MANAILKYYSNGRRELLKYLTLIHWIRTLFIFYILVFLRLMHFQLIISSFYYFIMCLSYKIHFETKRNEQSRGEEKNFVIFVIRSVCSFLFIMFCDLLMCVGFTGVCSHSSIFQPHFKSIHNKRTESTKFSNFQHSVIKSSIALKMHLRWFLCISKHNTNFFEQILMSLKVVSSRKWSIQFKWIWCLKNLEEMIMRVMKHILECDFGHLLRCYLFW